MMSSTRFVISFVLFAVFSTPLASTLDLEGPRSSSGNLDHEPNEAVAVARSPRTGGGPERAEDEAARAENARFQTLLKDFHLCQGAQIFNLDLDDDQIGVRPTAADVVDWLSFDQHQLDFDGDTVAPQADLARPVCICSSIFQLDEGDDLNPPCRDLREFLDEGPNPVIRGLLEDFLRVDGTEDEVRSVHTDSSKDDGETTMDGEGTNASDNDLSDEGEIPSAPERDSPEIISTAMAAKPERKSEMFMSHRGPIYL